MSAVSDGWVFLEFNFRSAGEGDDEFLAAYDRRGRLRGILPEGESK